MDLATLLHTCHIKNNSANLLELLDDKKNNNYKTTFRVYFIQNGQSGFHMLVLVELGNPTSPPAGRLSFSCR